MHPTRRLALIGMAGIMAVGTAFSGDDACTYRGVAGQWLTNGVAEAFVSSQPYPRVAAFRLRGGASPFRESPTDPFCGVRTWFMEPADNEFSSLPERQPATLAILGTHAARLTGAPEPTTGLQLIMEVTLDQQRPVLTIRHGLRNLRPTPRRLALWPIMAFPHQGAALMPWTRGQEGFRSCQFFWATDPNEPCIWLGREALGVAFRLPVRAHGIKIGTRVEAGWAAYLWNGQILKSTVPFVAGAEYPEGGATLTLYNRGRQVDQGQAEVEHVGPFRALPVGGVAWVEQRLELLPIVPPAQDTVDEWLKAVPK
jgi:hypothetical protein